MPDPVIIRDLAGKKYEIFNPNSYYLFDELKYSIPFGVYANDRNFLGFFEALALANDEATLDDIRPMTIYQKLINGCVIEFARFMVHNAKILSLLNILENYKSARSVPDEVLKFARGLWLSGSFSVESELRSKLKEPIYVFAKLKEYHDTMRQQFTAQLTERSYILPELVANWITPGYAPGACVYRRYSPPPGLVRVGGRQFEFDFDGALRAFSIPANLSAICYACIRCSDVSEWLIAFNPEREFPHERLSPVEVFGYFDRGRSFREVPAKIKDRSGQTHDIGEAIRFCQWDNSFFSHRMDLKLVKYSDESFLHLKDGPRVEPAVVFVSIRNAFTASKFTGSYLGFAEALVTSREALEDMKLPAEEMINSSVLGFAAFIVWLQEHKRHLIEHRKWPTLKIAKTFAEQLKTREYVIPELVAKWLEPGFAPGKGIRPCDSPIEGCVFVGGPGCKFDFDRMLKAHEISEDLIILYESYCNFDEKRNLSAIDFDFKRKLPDGFPGLAELFFHFAIDSSLRKCERVERERERVDRERLEAEARRSAEVQGLSDAAQPVKEEGCLVM